MRSGGRLQICQRRNRTQCVKPRRCSTLVRFFARAGKLHLIAYDTSVLRHLSCQFAATAAAAATSSSSSPPPPPLQSVAADWTSIPCLPLARLPVDQCYLRRDIIARAPAQPGEARHTSYTTTTTAAATVTSAAICASFPPHPVSRLYTRVADGGTRLDSRS